MGSVYIVEQHYPFEGGDIIGVYSRLDSAKDMVSKAVDKSNLKSAKCAAFYRWKRHIERSNNDYSADNMCLGERFYSFRNKWGLIRESWDRMEWYGKYSSITITKHDLDVNKRGLHYV